MQYIYQFDSDLKKNEFIAHGAHGKIYKSWLKNLRGFEVAI